LTFLRSDGVQVKIQDLTPEPNIRFLQKPALYKERLFHSLYSVEKDVCESGKK